MKTLLFALVMVLSIGWAPAPPPRIIKPTFAMIVGAWDQHEYQNRYTATFGPDGKYTCVNESGQVYVGYWGLNGNVLTIMDYWLSGDYQKGEDEPHYNTYHYVIEWDDSGWVDRSTPCKFQLRKRK